MSKICKRLLALYDSGAAHIILGSFVTKFVSLFGSIFVIRLLTKNDYGVLQYVENIYSYVFLFAGLGLPFSILRYVVVAKSGTKRAYFNYAVFHSLVRDFLICVLLIIINNFISYPDNFKEAKIFIPVFAILLPFQNLVTNGLYSLRAIFKNKEYAYASLAFSTFLIIGRILGAKTHGIDGVIWLRVLINVVFSILILVWIIQVFPKSEKNKLTKDEKTEVNSYSLQYMVTSGLWVVFMLNDSFLLGLLTNDPALVADYKVAYVLPGNLSLISNAIGMFVAPYFTKNEKNFEWVRKNFIRTALVTAAPVFVLSLLFFVFAKPVIAFIYGDAYINVIPLMQVLLISAFINSGFRYVAANILSAMGKVKSNLIVSSFGIVLQVVFDLILIPKYGAMGVAYSSCIVFTIMTIALFIIFYTTYFKGRFDKGQSFTSIE